MPFPCWRADGRVIGVVSEADLLPKEEFRDRDPDRFTQLRRLTDPWPRPGRCPPRS